MYLGPGSGKTVIAVMLIKHMRDLLGRDKMVVFLVNNVAFLEQQAQVIRDFTGLTGSYCGAEVDDWCKEKWVKEVMEKSVTVFIHHVFLDAVAHGFISVSSLALLVLVIDECFHAVKNHPYSNIMTDWYHPAKAKWKGSDPKVFGFSASTVAAMWRLPVLL